MLEDAISRVEKLDFEREFVVDEILDRKYTYCDFFSHALSVADYIEQTVSGESIISSSELLARRFLPCTPLQAVSPTA